jgi:hypothetical protein
MRHRHFPLLITAVGIVLTLGSLRVGWRLDDFYERWIICGSPAYGDVGRPTMDAFCFFDGQPHRNQRLIDLGLLPWWVDPRVKGAFWKPLTVLTHMLDYRLWPATPSLMHAQSILWFAVWIWSACLLYRRMMRRTVAAGLAGLLYALDYSRAIPAAWLANRNAVLAGLFGILAILAHDRSCRHRARAFAILSPLLLALSLLSAEAGIGAVGYLIAYALTIDPQKWRRGLLRLWPDLLVVIAWRIAWNAQGAGVYAMDDIYTDPGAHPLGFAHRILQRAPLYMLAQWAAIPIEIHLVLARPGLVAMRWAGIVVSVIVIFLLIPLLRRSRVARFWGLGMLLATIPMCAAAPMNRHLVFIGLGGMGLLGQLLAVSLRRRFWRRSLVARGSLAALVTLLVLVHVILSPIVLAILSRYPLGPDALLDNFHVLPQIPRRDRDMVFVNYPLPMEILHLFTARAVDHQPLPRGAQVLAPASTALLIRRTDDNSLMVRPDWGYFATVASGLGYSREHPLRQGQTLAAPMMRITILEMTRDGRPAAALFQFHVPLEDPSLQWIYWQDGRFRQFQPPPIGRAVRVPASGLPF